MDEKALMPPALNTPYPWSKMLVEALLPFATPQSYRKGIRLDFIEADKPICRIIVSGSVEAHRTADHLLVVRVSAPSILGLGISDSYIITAEPCKIATLSLAEVHQHIQELGMWEVLAKHMVVVSSKLFSYSRQLSAPTAYEVICSQLIELMHESESLRETLSVERFIRDRTHLSRSSIMKILADLRLGGYISIENGRLLAIHHLPQKY
ncbi:helix-turn-helix domain-containing protein [Citrobacter sp. Awk 4]|uniref:winged helix-turn-helix transcriptional regulator n=1 Tax=Citrobacter sp. Awk 4 TaxID=2963955 RepID=UPI002302E0F9|nr:winged helix-turn-helix transcriptional regulator [Citrobacter sp. Awk 4]MDA8481279.1 helix-turn-helix domain-containing protein [Citrobacter sp. Awk 4]